MQIKINSNFTFAVWDVKTLKLNISKVFYTQIGSYDSMFPYCLHATE